LKKIKVLEIIQTIGIGGAETVMYNTACHLDKSLFPVYRTVFPGGAQYYAQMELNPLSFTQMSYQREFIQNWIYQQELIKEK